MRPQGSQASSVIAWLLCAVVVGLIIVSGIFVVLNKTGISTLMFLVSVFCCAVVGGMVASRLPANPVGWFFLFSSLSFASAVLTDEYATYGLLTEPGSLPLAQLMVWPQSWLWVPGAVLILAFVPLYFPNGRLISGGWRPVVWLGAGFSLVGAVYSAVSPGEIQDSGFVNPLDIAVNRMLMQAAGAVMLPLWLGFLVLSAASVVVRYRRSVGEQRQQIKWLAFSVSLVPLWFLVSPAIEAALPMVFQVVEPLVFAGVPIAVGIAMLRYHLYDIDLIINRTLVYGALTICVLGMYVLLVGYTGALFNVEDNVVVSLAATAAVAIAFAPLRERLQRGVDHLMYGERNDPYEVISRFGKHLKTTTAPEAVLQLIASTAAGALKLPYVAIELIGGNALGSRVEHGTRAAGMSLVIPLSYGAETIGRMLVSPRAPGEPFSMADRRLLDDLARHAEAAAHAMLLTADLQRSRERLVNAREEERRRLRRDLHDGLGPQLATLTLKMDAVRNLVRRDPEAADALMVGLKEQTQAAISDIRRLVYDLRPPALDELGLLPALCEQAATYGVHGLDISLEAPERLPPLPAAVEVAAYRIVQEALTNVIRHAGARFCRISITLGEKLIVEITDDGVGLDEERRAGVGFASMAERAAELGGTCTVERLSPAGGTRVIAKLPLSAAWRGA